MSRDNVVYNSQLVSYLLALHRLHNAEFAEDAFSLYHSIQESAQGTSGVGPALPALGHALAGSLATASAKALLYPIELLVTRLQVQRQLRGKGEAENAAKDADKEYKSLVDAAQKIYETEGGLKAFYTGLGPDVGKGIADAFLFFLSYNFLRQYEQKRLGSKHLPVAKELGVGIAAGSLAKLFTTPIQNIVTRQQTAALVAARDPTATTTPGESDKLSIKDIALQIRKEKGLAGFWSGYEMSVILTLNPALTFAIDNLLWRLLPKSRKENPGPQVTFLLAAISKAVATTITYPVMLAKSRAQVSSSSSTGDSSKEEEARAIGGTPEYLEKPNMNSTPERRKVKQYLKKVLILFQAQQKIIYGLRSIYRTEGLAGLYSGLEGEVLKGFLQHGLTMVMKEKVHVGVIQLYYLLLRITGRWSQELQKAQEGAKEVAADAQTRAANVGETVYEGGRNLVSRATGQGQKAQEGAKDVATDAQERAADVVETGAEAAKNLVGRSSGQNKD